MKLISIIFKCLIEDQSKKHCTKYTRDNKLFNFLLFQMMFLVGLPLRIWQKLHSTFIKMRHFLRQTNKKQKQN